VFNEQWATFVSNHPRIWLLLDFAGGQNADWNAYLSQSLGQTGYLTTDEWTGPEQRLVHYASSAPSAMRSVDMNAEFGEKLMLHRIELDEGPLQGGGVLRLQLEWQGSSGSEHDDLHVFGHLVSEQGQLLAQQDMPLLSSGRMGLLLPVDLAAGMHQLHVGVYDPQTGQRLLLPSGLDSAVVEGIEVR
jgi:hypothetical protein